MALTALTLLPMSSTTNFIHIFSTHGQVLPFRALPYIHHIHHVLLVIIVELGVCTFGSTMLNTVSLCPPNYSIFSIIYDIIKEKLRVYTFPASVAQKIIGDHRFFMNVFCDNCIHSHFESSN